MRSSHSILQGPGPMLATAVHDGHDLRAEVASYMRLDPETRLREEDPGTAAWTAIAPTRIVVHRSRFEVDMNRPRDGAVYVTPEHSWGLDVWRAPLPSPVIERSLGVYDLFYSDVDALVERVVRAHGGALVLDLHTYNHRRDGPGTAPAPAGDNPDINLGTQWIDRRWWAPVVDAFLQASSRTRVGGHALSVGENVRFRGGHLGAHLSAAAPRKVCVLSIEVKKFFMDEWTGRIDERLSADVRSVLAAAAGPALEAFRSRMHRRWAS